MIRTAASTDLDAVLAVINDGARAYGGIIPTDCFHSPYMSREELLQGIAQGIRFYVYERADQILGVMGIQHVHDVTLIRHAYVRSACQGQGIGASLLLHLRQLTTKPILIGAWADAVWAIRFYQRHGFHLVSLNEKDRLLQTYWTVSPRQIQTSVVLADQQDADQQDKDRVVPSQA